MSKARFASIYGASQGNHPLGSLASEASWAANGVSVVAGPALQFDGSKNNEWRPRALGSVSVPAGWSRIGWCWQFPYTISTGTVGTAHYIMRRTYGGTGSSSPQLLAVMEKTNRDLEFYLDDVLMLTWTPSATHHIYITIMKGDGTTPSIGAGEEAWLTIWIDKTLVLNVRHVMTSAINPTSGAPYFGEPAAITGSSALVWKIGNYAAGLIDRDDLLGKVTAKNWGWTTGGTPYTGYDEATKSTGTDAAALIDEIPPNGTGTTDSDYYYITDTAGRRYQTSDLADNLLAAGDVMQGAISKVWDRAVGSGKSGSIAAILHDGTNVPTVGLVSLTAPTSYAEHMAASSQPIIWDTAPDGAEWPAKANAYLNGIEGGVQAVTGLTANDYVSTIVIEAAIVLSGDGISTPADPPALGFKHSQVVII